MTGADEHGQKIAETAERQGVTPKQLCDTYVSKFQARRGSRLPACTPLPTVCHAGGNTDATDAWCTRVRRS
jgi:hypothetical protein